MRVVQVTVVTPRPQAPESEPVGNLAQVMRGIFFPNSNIIATI
jgi:hypothetical protein